MMRKTFLAYLLKIYFFDKIVDNLLFIVLNYFLEYSKCIHLILRKDCLMFNNIVIISYNLAIIIN